ncbi:MAG: type II toxin-antitoxin system HicA family toxin [Bacteroidetes bacterium]|nr:MAG: type II toxin-antitoxin system HicA family toxin [Bacteroidota bacterium]
MSTKFPVLTAREIITVIRKHGFEFDHQTGSHAVYLHADGRRTTIPIHGKRDIGKGLLRQIMRDTELTVEDFR